MIISWAVRKSSLILNTSSLDPLYRMNRWKPSSDKAIDAITPPDSMMRSFTLSIELKALAS
jgi:hypothetical protein